MKRRIVVLSCRAVVAVVVLAVVAGCAGGKYMTGHDQDPAASAWYHPWFGGSVRLGNEFVGSYKEWTDDNGKPCRELTVESSAAGTLIARAEEIRAMEHMFDQGTERLRVHGDNIQKGLIAALVGGTEFAKQLTVPLVGAKGRIDIAGVGTGAVELGGQTPADGGG